MKDDNATIAMSFEPSSRVLKNLFPTIGSASDLMDRVERRFLENSERLQWGYNRSDIPPRPSVAALNGNDTYILDVILEEKNDKNGYQRTLDNKILAMSENSFAKNSGHLIYKSALSNFRPALKWIKISVFGVDDVSDGQLMASLKHKAGLEMLSFLDYFSENLGFFARYFGPNFIVEGCDFAWQKGDLQSDCRVGVSLDGVSSKPIVDIFQGGARNPSVQYIVDAILN